MFTPSTKATEGHDENISFDQAVDLVGKELAEQARDLCVEAYRRGAAAAERNGIIVADTKFELGIIDGELALCDEVLTPDSSRFWPADQWKPGTNPPAFDKQPVRDLLEASGWDKTPAASAPAARGGDRDERALHRGLRADQRAQIGRLVRCEG